MIWTAAADKLMLDLWARGFSMAVIEMELQLAGYNINRNAIAGRKFRLREQGREIRLKPTNGAIVTKPKSRPVAQRPLPPKNKVIKPATIIAMGVDYLDNEDGCKAVLEKRGGKFGLRMCCGLPCSDHNGSLASYCQTHLRLHTTPPPDMMRKAKWPKQRRRLNRTSASAS